jgi:hypothetical protein
VQLEVENVVQTNRREMVQSRKHKLQPDVFHTGIAGIQHGGWFTHVQIQASGVFRPLCISSVHQVPVLVKPQCMLLRNLGCPLKTSVQMPLGQQDLSAH